MATVRPDPLVLEHETGDMWWLRNTTEKEIAVERVGNLDAFDFPPLDLLPRVIQPKDAAEVTLTRVYGDDGRVASSLELRIRGRDDILRVPIPPG